MCECANVKIREFENVRLRLIKNDKCKLENLEMRTLFVAPSLRTLSKFKGLIRIDFSSKLVN